MTNKTYVDKIKRSYMSCFLHCIYLPVLTGMLQLCRSAWTLEMQYCPKKILSFSSLYIQQRLSVDFGCKCLKTDTARKET